VWAIYIYIVAVYWFHVLQGWLAVQNSERGAFDLFFLLLVVSKEILFHKFKIFRT
jgi:hypothetical protein